MKDTVATDAPLISNADLTRLEQMRKVPIESVADEASMLIMAVTMSQCLRGLAVSDSEEETSNILGAAFQLLFMLGRASALH